VKQSVVKIITQTNKLWCKSTTNPFPVLRNAHASRGFSELTKNVIRSSHGHSTLFLKISCKSVQPFSRNLANKETKKQRKIHAYEYKQRNRPKTIPRPPIYRGRGKNIKVQELSVLREKECSCYKSPAGIGMFQCRPLYCSAYIGAQSNWGGGCGARHVCPTIMYEKLTKCSNFI